MCRFAVAGVALLVGLLSACSPAGGSAPIAPASDAVSAPPSAPQRIPLPPGFPVAPRAAPVAMPDEDPGLIGRWTTDAPGSVVYDFYVRALPAAGYRIVAVFPGGAAAVIRFSLPGGVIWQVVTRAGPEGSVEIEVRLDRR